MTKLLLLSIILISTTSCSPKIYTLSSNANQYGVSVAQAYTIMEYPGEQTETENKYLYIDIKSDGSHQIVYQAIYYDGSEYMIESDRFPNRINLNTGTPNETYISSSSDASIVCSIDGEKVILRVANIKNQDPIYMP